MHVPAADPVDLVIPARARSIGAFSVRRVLPYAKRRMVGPFVFLDHMGPVELPPGTSADVRPHPHIGLATVTYLFEGEMVHRDSLGTEQVIRPGDVNWMTAGRGIVHSERGDAARRAGGGRAHGLQLWVALPDADEDAAPMFDHYPKDALPVIEDQGARLTVIAGRFGAAASPVRTLSDLFYVHAEAGAGARILVPAALGERAFYVVEGRVSAGGETIGEAQMAVLRDDADAEIVVNEASRIVLIGGTPLGPRHIWWNFVSSSAARIERARADWRAQRFPPIPGEAPDDFIPLPPA